MRYRVAVFVLLWLAVSGTVWRNQTKEAAAASQPSPYLFVWSADATHQASDFLAVINSQPSSPDYGRIVSRVAVGVSGTMPHHTEYEFPEGDMLFADGWVAGRSFLFDLHEPLKPRVAVQFTQRAGYSFPHSYIRLPNGHVLTAFQSHGEGYAPGGGLVELDERGAVVRSASAVDPAVDKDVIWPYSLMAVPAVDRVVSSSTPMGWPEWAKAKLPPGSWAFDKINNQVTSQVQVWKLSDLHLLSTLSLADANGKHNLYPAEPRVLSDGSVYVNTFSCGLYLMKDLKGNHPSAEMVYSFPGGDSFSTACAVPVVVGHYWIQTVAALPGLIALDVTNPEKPVEVSRLKLDTRYPEPHWMAADRKSNRLVITGNDKSWVLVAKFDTEKRSLSLDQSFHEPGSSIAGISFDPYQWPDGKAGSAVVHGALFGPE